MTILSDAMRDALGRNAAAVFIEIVEANGSTPREAGARMLVGAEKVFGTIGGGQMEFHAIDVARDMKADGVEFKSLDLSLGPHLGQCCGGRVLLALRRLTPDIMARQTEDEAAQALPRVMIFGAGHTGLALAKALALLPVRVTVIDDRHGLSLDLPPHVEFLRQDNPEEALLSALPNAAVVVLTHSHALDYALADAALRRDDLSYVGMIGSATKRARFRRWFRQRGGKESSLSRLVCPIGGDQVRDKRPEVIAALTSAELLHRFFAARSEADRDQSNMNPSNELKTKDFAA